MSYGFFALLKYPPSMPLVFKNGACSLEVQYAGTFYITSSICQTIQVWESVVTFKFWGAGNVCYVCCPQRHLRMWVLNFQLCDELFNLADTAGNSNPTNIMWTKQILIPLQMLKTQLWIYWFLKLMTSIWTPVHIQGGNKKIVMLVIFYSVFVGSIFPQQRGCRCHSMSKARMWDGMARESEKTNFWAETDIYSLKYHLTCIGLDIVPRILTWLTNDTLCAHSYKYPTC